MWRFVVTHFKFTKPLEDLAESYLHRALDVPEGHAIPHVRPLRFLRLPLDHLRSSQRCSTSRSTQGEVISLAGAVRSRAINASPRSPRSSSVYQRCKASCELSMAWKSRR